MSILLGGLLAITLLVPAVWVWLHAPRLVLEWEVASPRMALLAMRMGCLGIAAAAQTLIVALVLESIWPADRGGAWMKLLSGAVSVIGMTAALLAGLAAR